MIEGFFGPDGSPLSKPEDVRPFLGKPELHWKERYSAYEAAQSWFAAKGLPPAIRDLLRSDKSFDNARLVSATFEKQTAIDNLPRGLSQTDVLVIVQIGARRAVLGVEAKVNEPFGELVAEWNDYSPSKLRRLAILVEKLGLRSKQIETLRYQLLHRAVAALIEAEAEKASDALLIVQSFSPNDIRTGFTDFANFAATLGIPVEEPGKLSAPSVRGNVRLRLGWTVNDMYRNG
jgi:hypothetical protein